MFKAHKFHVCSSDFTHPCYGSVWLGVVVVCHMFMLMTNQAAICQYGRIVIVCLVVTYKSQDTIDTVAAFLLIRGAAQLMPEQLCG